MTSDAANGQPDDEMEQYLADLRRRMAERYFAQRVEPPPAEESWVRIKAQLDREERMNAARESPIPTPAGRELLPALDLRVVRGLQLPPTAAGREEEDRPRRAAGRAFRLLVGLAAIIAVLLVVGGVLALFQGRATGMGSRASTPPTQAPVGVPALPTCVAKSHRQEAPGGDIRLTLTIDSAGLLSGTEAARDDVRRQVRAALSKELTERSKGTLSYGDARVGIALVYGAATREDVGRGRNVAQAVIEALRAEPPFAEAGARNLYGLVGIDVASLDEVELIITLDGWSC